MEVPPSNSSYAVTLISDTHFDEGPWTRYRGDWDPPAEARARKDHLRNLDMWQSRLPRLLAAAAQLSRQEPTDFVLHLGDIAQGHAADAAALTCMLEQGWQRLTAAFGTLPIYLLIGNHDVLAPEGVAAYLAWARRPANRVFRHGPDAWILVDSDRPPELAALQDLFRQAEGARWTFFLTHRPLFPFSGVCHEFLYGEASQSTCRQELRRLLAERAAVVLTAHIHTLTASTFDFPEGRVTQFAVNSLWEREELSEINLRTIRSAKWCRKLSGIPAERQAAFTALAEEYRPYLTEHRQSHAAGHFRLYADDDAVRLALYGGDATTPAETIDLAIRRDDQNSTRPTKARILRKIADFLRRGLSKPRTSTSR